MKYTIEYCNVEMEADIEWPSDDLEEMVVKSLCVGGVNIWSVLMQAASDGAKAVGNGNGVMRSYDDDMLADKLCELIAKEVERVAADEADRAAEDEAYQEAIRP